MAMNKQRRTANLNNIVTYDTLKNVTLLANLTVEGLTGAGFVKADVNGLLSVDTAAYLPMPSQTGNAGKYLTTDGSVLSWGTVSTANIYNSNGTLTSDRIISTGAYKLAVQWNAGFSANNATPTTNIFNVKSSIDENAISVWSNGAVGIGRNAGNASNVSGYALAVDNGNNTGIYTGTLYSVTTVSALNGGIVMGIYGSKSINIFDGASDGYMSYTAANGLILSSGAYAGVKYNTTLQVNGGAGLRIFGPTGNAVIGGSTFTDAGYKLDVQGTMRVAGAIRNTGTNENVIIHILNESQSVGYRSVLVGRTQGTVSGVGIGFSVQSAGGVSIGATVTSGNGVSVGNSSVTTSGATLGLGSTSLDGVSVGTAAISNFQAIAIGNSVNAVATSSSYNAIAIGNFSYSVDNTFVAGSSVRPITEIYFGSGITNLRGDLVQTTGAGISYTINGSGAFGTDFAGGNITIAGGKGTGTGTPGDVIISTATPTTSGTTLQALSQRMWVKGGTGNVIIGTTASTTNNYTQLSVNAYQEPALYLNSGGSHIGFLYNSFGNVALQYQGPNGTNDIIYYNSSTKDLDLGTNGTTKVRVVSSGNVLVNTTTDQGIKFQVVGDAIIGGAFTVSGSTGMPAGTASLLRFASGFSSPDIGRMYIGDGSGWKFHMSKRLSSVTTDLVTFQDNGNVIISSSVDSGQKLQVSSTSGDNHFLVWGATAPSIRIDNAASGATQRFVFGLATATNNFITGSVAGDVCMTTQSSNPLLFGANATEVMRLTVGGNLLINKTTDGGQKLQVSGSINFASLPTSSAGLSAGDIWNNSGVLNIV